MVMLTVSSASTTTADAATGRRYLVAIKTQDGQADSLIFKVGPSDADIDGGADNPIAESAEAQWMVSDANNGMVYLKNFKTGTYLQIANTLSANPVSVYPYYAAEDNSKHAFYIETSNDNNRCLNVGTPDASGMQGNLLIALVCVGFSKRLKAIPRLFPQMLLKFQKTTRNIIIFRVWRFCVL